MSRSLRLVWVVLAALLVGACGIETDGSPRDITGDRQEQLAEVGRTNLETPTGGSRIFLIDASSAQNPVVRAVARAVPSEPESLIASLLQGPTVSERAQRLRTAIPAGTTLLGVRYAGPGIVTVNLSANILEASGDSLVAAVAQIVYTLDETENFRGVRLQIDGESRQWPTGDGTLTSAPLSVYLYPGRAATTQPEYPALPSATPSPLSP